MTHALGELHIHLRAQLGPLAQQISAALHTVSRAFAGLLNSLNHPTPRQRRAHLKHRDRLARHQRNTRWPHATRTKTTYHQRRR